MIRVYVAGAYGADNVIGVLDNMRQGIGNTVTILNQGFAVYCPWLDFQFGLAQRIELETYQANSIAWLEVSDVMFLVPGWEQSKGAQAELYVANDLGIPVYTDVELLLRYRDVLESMKAQHQKELNSCAG
jgi:hypothetical protein